ncbi:MAG TPA: hypothetical protein VMU67_03700 [Steroidobacteraceae bacterium]|nr:hypothetical protein [Steroidobacteraceae bacterium]
MEFCLVEPENGLGAYQWHRGFAAANNHLFPRTWEVYERLAADGQVWCARDGREFAALAYFLLDQGAWEVGGLMVSTQARSKGIASVLARLTLGHLLFTEDPLSRGERVVMHVHRENPDPRALIERKLRFKLAREIEADGSEFPGLRQNAHGKVQGDEFEIGIPESLLALAEWCDSWSGSLTDGSAAVVTLSPHTSLSMWAEAFRDMTQRHG